MIYYIENEQIKVQVRQKGAELCSIQDAVGREYLWQGEETTWPDQSPILFPYVGRMWEKKYCYQGREYSMDIHGFAKDQIFVCQKIREDYLLCYLEDNRETRSIYPFAFRFEVHFELSGSRLSIYYIVKNREDKIMYFGIGGHPGFKVPLEEQEQFNEYYLEFPKEAKLKKVGINNRGFLEGEATDYPLEEGNRLPLYHEMFDEDALFFEGTGEHVELCGPKGVVLSVRYPQMKRLGLWHWPQAEVPYVCIEPWSSLPSRNGVIENLEEKPDLVALEAYGTYTNMWEIEIVGERV